MVNLSYRVSYFIEKYMSPVKYFSLCRYFFLLFHAVPLTGFVHSLSLSLSLSFSFAFLTPFSKQLLSLCLCQYITPFALNVSRYFFVLFQFLLFPISISFCLSVFSLSLSLSPSPYPSTSSSPLTLDTF